VKQALHSMVDSIESAYAPVRFQLLGMSMVALFATCVIRFWFDSSVSYEGGRKLTHRHSGQTQGLWIETGNTTMALVTRHKLIEKLDSDALPFVEVYVKEGGKDPEMPYAMIMRDGVLHLQIPAHDDRGHLVIPMSTVVRLVDEDTEHPKPGLQPQQQFHGLQAAN
jgi:hypothetical protein